ncbi:alanine--tRNA ligase [Paraferrimonas haliotis]|uniref:Alanine--tRNA ligase n=1 Tax=Paraferrimonas haliotis TaxID=2013866 RepID=A0AA37TK96_9GAMM|nr:alanine--tRNA ligase [Paraferrimonas haliotis]GLS82799.1 alanine--tRNA ligase [Paraferrimonas haliotis]
MRNMTTAELREAFLGYFGQHGHQRVDSSSLVPHNDPTLLFTNAGMNQFKDVFLGQQDNGYTRATTSQRCVRAGGKHNDLDNVGYTARHHTFFEMLGNFSFGDYFKEEAINFAWTFLTEELQLPKDKLWVTVFEDDDEAADIWINKIGVNPERLSRIGAKDNFWQMGDTGPCGPCTEIFYDHGEHIWGGPPGTPEEDGDRYIEIWNLVFMQFNRQSDGSMEPLPKPSVDTGMGLERIAAILQGVHSNYEIDVFQDLIKHIANKLNVSDLEHASLRVIADHIRSCAFLISDGVLPSNEGRGYVLRRIIRRAVRHGNKLGAEAPFFYTLVGKLIEVMGSAAKELAPQQASVEKALKAEEEQFARTLDRGMALLNGALDNLAGDTLDGETVFKLYDTYGFPVDLTADVCRERNIKVDQDGFESHMAAQRARAQAANQFGTDYNEAIKVDGASEFCGYSKLEQTGLVQHLFQGAESVQTLEAGSEAVVVLDSTAFYPESGGQVGDQGLLIAEGVTFEVADTQKYGNAIGHIGRVTSGQIKLGQSLTTQVNKPARHRTALNHSVTHLLHAALRNELGEHVTQKGSIVKPEYLRFDFSHFEGVTKAQLQKVEDEVNRQIRRNHSVSTELMELEQAKAAGAMALFGEKYDDQVRVVTMGDFSTELCGGCHVERTGDIGLFKFTSESGIAAGVRRVEAVTGQLALDKVAEEQTTLNRIATLLKGDSINVLTKLEGHVERTKQLEKQLQQLQDKLAAAESSDLATKAQQINGVNVVVHELKGGDPKALRGMVDELKQKLSNGIIVLAISKGDKVSLIAGVTKDLVGKVKAGELVAMVAAQIGGKGGGRPDMAQAGGSQPENLPKALASVSAWLEERL